MLYFVEGLTIVSRLGHHSGRYFRYQMRVSTPLFRLYKWSKHTSAEQDVSIVVYLVPTV